MIMNCTGWQEYSRAASLASKPRRETPRFLASSLAVINIQPAGENPLADEPPLALTVGCQFGLLSSQPAVAVLQVAPRPRPGVAINGEHWYTSAAHHGYVDHYGNRCERFELASGGPDRARYARDRCVLAPRRCPQLRNAKPLLPARRAGARGVAAFRRPTARVGTRASHRGLRPHLSRLRARRVQPVDHSRRRLPRRPGCMP